MSRLWSRFGIRALAVGVLAVGVAGAAYLGKDRETQQTGIEAAAWTQADEAEQQMMKEHMRQQAVALAQKRAAEQVAAVKAAAEAKAAADRAKRAEEEASRKKAASRDTDTPATDTPTKPPPFGPVPASCKEYSGNRAIGCALLLDAGFKLDQMPCLEKLWTKESGWNEKAANGSGAYGIPQAKPGSKMSANGADWETNPATQIKWGLGYIEDRYDTPCGAWQHWEDAGWY